MSNVVVDPSTTLTAAASGTTTCTTGTKSGALNLTTTFTFDGAGNVNSINGPRPDSPVADATTYIFDASRQLRQIDGPPGTDFKTVFDYYDDGSLKTIDRQERVGGAAVMRRETRVYWPSGDLFTITDPKSNQTRHDYDLAGRVTLTTDPDGRRVGTVYDAVGQTRCTWRGWNSTSAPTSCTWDPASYVSAGNNGPLRYAEYTYTLNGKQKTVTDAKNNTTEYVYDNHDKLRYTFFPNASNGTRCALPAALPGGVETGSPTCTAGGGTTPRYEDLWYTTNGTPTGTLCSGDVQVCRKRTRAAQAITFTYDQLNRVRTKAAAGLPTVTYAYTLLDEPLSLTSPLSGSIPAHGIQYDYDDAGRRRFEENLAGAGYRRVSYTYDEAGNRTSTTWPDTYTVSYEYDALNRVLRVWQGAATTGLKLADYTYDSLSRRKSARFASSATNEAQYQYEPDDQLDVLTQTLASPHSFSLNYGHTAAGRIRTIVASDDFFLPTPAVGPAVLSVPNRLNQYGSFAGQSASYDANGNLASWIPLQQSRHTYTYDSESRLRTAATDGTTTPTITYDYDPLGRRLTKNVNGIRTGYLLDGDEEIAEYSIDAGGAWAATPARRYIGGAGVDDRVATIDPVDGLRYYHVNHQGSVLATTSASGGVSDCSGCQRMSYDEYGNLGAGSVATGQPYRFAGRRFDPETGLYYYRARYYSPVLGRFLQTDAAGYDDDLNSYAYVANDPVNRNDPRGLFSTAAHNAIIDYALADRVTAADLALIKAGSKWADTGRNQAPGRSFMHSMRADRPQHANEPVVQSAFNAIRLRDAHIEKMLDLAQKALADGKRGEAMFLFGVAIHAEMDATSPEHVDESGDPIVWHRYNFWFHGWGELSGDRFGCNECEDDVTQAILDSNWRTINERFHHVFEAPPPPSGTVTVTECPQTENGEC